MITLKNITFYGNPEKSKEEFVRHIFSNCAKQLGFIILNIQKKFPDCTAIDCRHGINRIVNIEFEYAANNFITHGHRSQMDPSKDYIIVCWLDTGKEVIPTDIEVISLSTHPRIEVLPPSVACSSLSSTNILYRAIAFDPKFIGGKPINFFEKISVFVTNNIFKNDYLPTGSIIVLFTKSFFVGEFEVVHYHKLDRPPSSDYEKNLFDILSFPVTFKSNIVNNQNYFKSYIAFKNFRQYNPPSHCSLIGKNLSHGVTSLTMEDLLIIRGQRPPAHIKGSTTI